jgi:hypothetical protein
LGEAQSSVKNKRIIVFNYTKVAYVLRTKHLQYLAHFPTAQVRFSLENRMFYFFYGTAVTDAKIHQSNSIF